MAQQLLSDAGFADGFSTQFWYMPVSRPYFPSAEPVASAVASYMADVGIQTELQTEDWGTYLDDNNTGKFPIYMLGWSADYADPDNFVYTFFGAEEGQRNFGWDNAEARNLLDQARQEPDEAARAELYGQINQLIHDQVPAIPVVHNPVLNAVRTRVRRLSSRARSGAPYRLLQLPKASKAFWAGITRPTLFF